MEIKHVYKTKKLYEEPARVDKVINVSDLREYIKNHLPITNEEFKPHVWYNQAGDIFEIYWSSESCYAEEVGNGIVVERSFETKEIVGVKFRGVKSLMGLVEVKEDD